MVGILIISHGRLAEALISSAQALVGNLRRITGVSIWPKDKKEEIKDRIQKKIEEMDDGDGVVVLTDIPGGTSANLGLSLMERRKAELVTGVNIPMLLTLLSYREGKSLEELGKLVKKSGRRSIILAKEVFSLKRGRRQKDRTPFIQ
jgi:PTS system mannose-specific IIA component